MYVHKSYTFTLTIAPECKFALKQFIRFYKYPITIIRNCIYKMTSNSHNTRANFHGDFSAAIINCHTGFWYGGKSLNFKHNLMLCDNSATCFRILWVDAQCYIFRGENSKTMTDLHSTFLQTVGNTHNLYDPQFSHLKSEMIFLIF